MKVNSKMPDQGAGRTEGGNRKSLLSWDKGFEHQGKDPKADVFLGWFGLVHRFCKLLNEAELPDLLWQTVKVGKVQKSGCARVDVL